MVLDVQKILFNHLGTIILLIKFTKQSPAIWRSNVSLKRLIFSLEQLAKLAFDHLIRSIRDNLYPDILVAAQDRIEK